MTGGPWHRSENVAFDAVSCATVPVLSEGGPAKWLKNKNLQNHLCDYEPGGREFESLRAHQSCMKLGTCPAKGILAPTARISFALLPEMVAVSPWTTTLSATDPAISCR